MDRGPEKPPAFPPRLRAAGQALARRLARAPIEEQQWPTLLVANATAALGLAAAIAGHADPRVLALWSALALAASLLPWAAIRLMPKLHIAPALKSGFLGLVWASFPGLLFETADLSMQALTVGLLFAMAGIGSIALAGQTVAAVVFCSMVVAALVLTAAKIGGGAGWPLAMLSACYGLALAALLIRSERAARLRAEAARELRKQNEIIALLLNGASQAQAGWLWESGPDGRLTYASSGLADAMGVPPASLVGRPFDSLVSAGEGDAEWHALQSAMLRRKPVDGLDVRLSFPRQGTWWRFTARPLFNRDGVFQGYRGAANDVTQSLAEQQRLEAARDEAERQSASKSQFLAMMSHELRTPLNAIVGFAEILSSPAAANADGETHAEQLKIILDSGHHLQRLINDVLDISRIEKGMVTLVEQETDAAELVEVSVKMCRDAADRSDATIVANVWDGVGLRCDITRVTQVLINLVTNALKFSPAGGFVHLGFERQPDDGIAIFVRDAGLGIAAADIERIFEPYVQVDQGNARRFGGAGLGLAIARRIALLHGGNVTIESELGVGTTARLVLPGTRVTWASAAANGSSRAA